MKWKRLIPYPIWRREQDLANRTTTQEIKKSALREWIEPHSISQKPKERAIYPLFFRATWLGYRIVLFSMLQTLTPQYCHYVLRSPLPNEMSEEQLQPIHPDSRPKQAVGTTQARRPKQGSLDLKNVFRPRTVGLVRGFRLNRPVRG